MKLKFVAALLAGSALCIAAPALAQDTQSKDQPAPTEPDPSDATADAAIANAKAVDDAQAKIELLQAQVEALQASIEQVKASMVKATPSWKGAPQFDDKDAGFSFKPRGAIQLDAGFNGFPRGNELRGTVGGLNYQNLGWNSRARRLLLGADGTLPGGFRYSAEFNFAQGAVDFEDVFIAYDFKNSPITAQIGHIYPFSSLETMTSSKFTSFMERAGITDASASRSPRTTRRPTAGSSRPACSTSRSTTAISPTPAGRRRSAAYILRCSEPPACTSARTSSTGSTRVRRWFRPTSHGRLTS
jgi:phosphate-selective porin OprO/OprP